MENGSLSQSICGTRLLFRKLKILTNFLGLFDKDFTVNQEFPKLVHDRIFGFSFWFLPNPLHSVKIRFLPNPK